MSFAAFFKAAWGYGPFPWQVRLAEQVLAGKWPESIGLPTAAGKTALIDIAVYALAMGAPNAARRIFFVVDRRVIVDEAAVRAAELAEKLACAVPDSILGAIAAKLREVGDGADASPLDTAVLRGGIARDNFWKGSPRLPLVVCSTVDQIGSSLLFRGYGASEYARPIRAAMAAYDSLIIVDEAHTSQPFVQTLQRLRQYRGWAQEPIQKPFAVVEMSATPRGSEVFREDEADKADPVLAKRWGASKRTRLIVPEKKEAEEKKDDLDWAALANAMAQEARNVRTEQAARIVGVIANRVRTARMIFDILKGENGDEAILLIGRARAWDRDRIWTQWKEKIGLDGKQRQDGLVFVVATQCIEVGANIDFDGLVTEIASVDALEQRFGRLNRGGRDGECHAAVVALKEQTAAKYDDAIYGKAMTATWAWLGKQAVALTEVKRKTKAKKFVEMGVLALRGALERTENRAELTCPRVSAPVLMPAHMDLLCQTSPEPALTPEPAVFLHGPQSEPEDVQIVWRRDLATDPATWIDTVAICPPSAAEAISMPVWSVRQWLLKKPAPDVADIEGASAPPDIRDKPGGGPTLWWRGAEKSVQLKSASAVKPGMLLVVPSTYGGCDDWGWNPDFEEPVRDVGDAVKLRLGKPMLRLDAALAEQWKYGDLARDLRGCDGVKEAKLLLKGWGGIPADPWVTDAVKRLADSRLKLVDDSQSDAEEQVAIAARGKVSRDGVEAPLDEHLAGCREWAAGYSLELPERLRATVARAAALHDIGKADPRFQAWLRGGNPVKPNELIAKSKSSPLNPAGIRKARELAGYPEGGRHELMSSAMVSTRIAEETDVDRDLLLHLIGSHHGMCRPFAPIIEDSAPVTVSYAGWSAESDHCLERLGSGVSARFWALTRKYGWYGLAYLEALVRLSDYKQSSEEQTSASRKAEAAHV